VSLTYEPITAAHGPLLFEWMREPRLYTYTDEPPPASEEALTARFARWAANAPEDEVWLNWLVRADGEPVGHLQSTVYPGERRALIAYVVFAPFQGRGIAREAVGWLLERLGERGVEIAEAVIDERNEASLRVVGGHGFRHAETRDGDASYVKELRRRG
jgi:RimJ/RimL family protein N-acetyltransferase